MRLIDACALQEEYKARHSGKRLLLIDVAPTVDAVPVRRGNWVGIDQEPCEMWECDRCGYVEECEDGEQTDFCPGCGADMRGDKHD